VNLVEPGLRVLHDGIVEGRKAFESRHGDSHVRDHCVRRLPIGWQALVRWHRSSTVSVQITGEEAGAINAVASGTPIAIRRNMSIHTKIAADDGVTVYTRVDEHEVDVTVVAGDEATYIIVDHRTRKAVCGPTDEQAWQNLRRVRAAAVSEND
jgi:hypothetical protein